MIVTFSGIIDYGFDNTGIFGTANQNLAGLTFTQSITANTNPALWTVNSGNSFFQEMSGFGPAFSDKVTINGNSVTFDVSGPSYGRQTLFNQLTSQGGGQDQIWTEQRGLTGNNDVIWGQQYAYSNTTSFIPSLDFSQQLDHTGLGLTSYSQFTITGERNAHFYSHNISFVISDSQTIDPPVTVSEPSSFGLLLAAIGIFALVRAIKLNKTA